MKSLNVFKIITYDKLVINTFDEIKKILYFLNLKIEEALIEECINNCSFDKLQQVELKEKKAIDIKTMKFRKGPSGNFHDDLNEIDIIKINKKIKD